MERSSNWQQEMSASLRASVFPVPSHTKFACYYTVPDILKVRARIVPVSALL
jgi:hypothetical protein